MDLPQKLAKANGDCVTAQSNGPIGPTNRTGCKPSTKPKLLALSYQAYDGFNPSSTSFEGQN